MGDSECAIPTGSDTKPGSSAAASVEFDDQLRTSTAGKTERDGRCTPRECADSPRLEFPGDFEHSVRRSMCELPLPVTPSENVRKLRRGTRDRLGSSVLSRARRLASMRKRSAVPSSPCSALRAAPSEQLSGLRSPPRSPSRQLSRAPSSVRCSIEDTPLVVSGGVSLAGPGTLHRESSCNFSVAAGCMSPLENHRRRKELKAVFAEVDVNGDNRVSVSELAQLFGKACDTPQLRVLVHEFAPTGRITFKEFEAFFEKITRGQAVEVDALPVKLQLESAIRTAVQHVGGAHKFLQAQDEIIAPPMVLFPDARYRQILHCMFVALVLLDTIDIAFLVTERGWYRNGSTSNDDWRVPFAVVSGLSAAVYTTEFALSFRTVALDGWQLVDTAKEISRRYAKTWCGFDLLMALPLDTVCAASGAGFTMFRVCSPIDHRPKWATLLFFMFWNLVTVVVLSAAWLPLADDDEGASEAETLVAAIYFVVTTLSSVGYGDISPATVGQRLFAILVELIGVMLLVFVGSISTAFILATDPLTEAMRDRRRRFAAMIRDLEVPWHMQKECFTVLPYIVEFRNGRHSEFLDELPLSMRSRIEAFCKVRVLRRVPLFGVADSDALLAIAGSLHNLLSGPGEYIVVKGDVAAEMYMIMHGCVEVLDEDDLGCEHCVANLRSGSFFGEIALVRDSTRGNSVRTVTACDFFVLDKQAFLQIVQSCPAFESAIRSELQTRGIDCAALTATALTRNPLNRVRAPVSG
eukprot:TRINITY_DN13567_c0_g1_i2.p1 TRINITY_DN13567_c0_g1~~TRINITY_DN13567_c0_g1_i2.p1  ORF type:complete len:766 (+),score=57.95 TRINITY_DN13567_c0_g1_i2:50-2299(+)